ncbi:hypothetical protein L3X38_037541 [Prunus dulcis]|uniref:Uncharacterized protein n=1 Tax=Prunus dulcis TaxID=3755 RepID=A0AAD4V3K9_PRUDU|nr:hypothetical protein L3X38_037541 [Prunus dulcis]
MLLSNQRNLFPLIHHSTEAFQITMVGIKAMRSKTVMTTQSARGPSYHNGVASNQLPGSIVETVTAIMAPAQAVASLYSTMAESVVPAHTVAPSLGPLASGPTSPQSVVIMSLAPPQGLLAETMI